MYAIDALYADETILLDNDGTAVDVDQDEIMGAYDIIMVGGHSLYSGGDEKSKFTELMTYNGPEEIKLLSMYGITIKNNKVGSSDRVNPMSDKYDMVMDLVPFENLDNDIPKDIHGGDDEYTFEENTDEENNEDDEYNFDDDIVDGGDDPLIVQNYQILGGNDEYTDFD